MKKRDAMLCIRLSVEDKARLKRVSDLSECSTSDLVVKAIKDMMDSLEGLSKKGHTHWDYPHELPKPKPTIQEMMDSLEALSKSGQAQYWDLPKPKSKPLAWFSELFSR